MKAFGVTLSVGLDQPTWRKLALRQKVHPSYTRCVLTKKEKRNHAGAYCRAGAYSDVAYS